MDNEINDLFDEIDNFPEEFPPIVVREVGPSEPDTVDEERRWI